MKRRISPVPSAFSDENERDYWHMAQDIAYRGNMALVQRGESSVLIDDEGERIVSRDKDRLWFSTWSRLARQYPELSRMWVGGRPINTTR